MTTITTVLPDELGQRLNMIARQTNSDTSMVVRQAIEMYLEDQEDYNVASQRLAGNHQRYTLEEIERKYGLEN